MRRRDPFVLWTAAAFAAALAVRWFLWWHWYRNVPIGRLNDNFYYHESANLLAHGHFFVNPFSAVNGIYEPTAAHPPGFTVYLSIWSRLGLDSVSWHRVASGLVSATVVIPLGLVVRRLAGSRAAVITMFVAAFYPPLFMNDGLILSESMYIPIAALVILFAYRFHDRPDTRRVIELSAVLAVGALTRSEVFMMYFLLLAPLVMIDRRLTWKRRFTLTAVAAGVAMAVLAPWVIRNLVTFEQPTYLAAGPGYVLEIGNCDQTYSGDYLGYWNPACDDGSAWPAGDESTIGKAKLNRAWGYISAHLDEQPKVISARVGRLFGLFKPIHTINSDVVFERRVKIFTRIGLWANYVVMLAAVAGTVLLRRRGETIIPLVAVVATAVVTAAISFGITRYRAGADVAMLIMASIVIGAALDRRPSPAALSETAEESAP